MGDVINLNRFRKSRAQAAARQEADANRRKFGRTKAEKSRQASDEARCAAMLDGAKLDD